MNLDNYLASYLDKQMSAIISEWQLSTKGELTDITRRFASAQEELAGLKRFERETNARLTDLEERIRKLKENQK
jgi:hypothetical protein